MQHYLLQKALLSHTENAAARLVPAAAFFLVLKIETFTVLHEKLRFELLFEDCQNPEQMLCGSHPLHTYPVSRPLQCPVVPNAHSVYQTCCIACTDHETPCLTALPFAAAVSVGPKFPPKYCMQPDRSPLSRLSLRITAADWKNSQIVMFAAAVTHTVLFVHPGAFLQIQSHISTAAPAAHKSIP